MSQDLRTINDALAIATSRGDQTVMLWQDATGAWLPISSSELKRRVQSLAVAFQNWGIQKGDRIALLSENRWEWALTDFAALALGAVDVPLYPTLTPEQAAYALRDSGARILVVSTRAQYDKVTGILSQTAVERILIMDSVAEALDKATPFADSMNGTGDDAAFTAMLAAVQPEDLATIIYTSGTTGESKGVMLTHGNIASNMNYSIRPFDFNESDISISFLPLSHITARHLDYVLLHRGTVLAYCPDFNHLVKAMQEVKPTAFVAVPRVYEKVRQAVEGKSFAAGGLKLKIFQWALKVGQSHRDQILHGKAPLSLTWQLANKLVYSKIREAFGGRVKHFISGGAPLGMDTAGWYADVGIRIHEGYGLTETSPVIALNNPTDHAIGTVGKPLENVECRLAADGELEVKGPSIFHGYWNKPDQDAESFTADGWFKTGDIAAFNSDGFLSITDRKKELLKTSGGKFIAPQPIEGKLKGDLLIAQAALVGDRHKFVSALLSPNFAALADWAKRQGIAADVSTTEGRTALVAEPRVKAAYKEIIDRVNATLAPYESIKRFEIVTHEWSIETGELTPSMKLKRRILVQNYADVIADFYRDEATAHRA
jgi:long-chain acyl-CoA synthetase